MTIPEKLRLSENKTRIKNWLKFGPYLTERQWGTVREDYSPYGTAWEYVSHDAARSKAYRWGEEGIGGISDNHQLICFSVAFWNKKDPILKERIFGLTGNEGNHGEDCKDYYYYLDNTPSHSYMKMLYKYPQNEFPYNWLVEENRRRSKLEKEFELLETGIFNDDKYFDVFIEYAKADEQDLVVKIKIYNRSKDEGTLHVIPQVWFRNTWSWGYNNYKPQLSLEGNSLKITHKNLRNLRLYIEGKPELLFTENDSNIGRLYGVQTEGHFKDAFNEFLIHKNPLSVNPEKKGTKAGLNYDLTIPAGSSETIQLRLSDKNLEHPFSDYDLIFESRKEEADEFYHEIQQDLDSEDLKNVQRQAFAGMLWSKQFYYFDIPQWLDGDPGQPAPPKERKSGRNNDWKHLNNKDIISMPDKWEYPWYAAWDLAFHCLPLAVVDPEFAKNQLILFTREWYMHPNGQLPAYEWQFGDVNPPVHAWATWRVYKIDEKHNVKGDRVFLERVFHKLLLNFTWWVNRKDKEGRNVFQGGFLGLDNIGVFDRGAPLPTGGFLEQSDGTSWMAMYCLNMMRIALELAKENHVYQDLASKFFEHFLLIADAMTKVGEKNTNLWDEEDEFYYDVLHTPDGNSKKLKIRSIVGLIPLFAVEVLDNELLAALPEFTKRMDWFLDNKPELAALISRWQEPGKGERKLLSLLRGHRMKRLLKRMLNEQEFLSDYGIRALSKYHKDHPYTLRINGTEFKVGYQPGESDTGLFGGNSNWRGPIWVPVNFLLIESLQKFHHYYGDDFKVEYPTGSGKHFTINEIAQELSLRLVKIFQKDENDERPVFRDNDKFQRDPHFRDYIFFHEYFHGDTGKGLGAMHQTGWTGLIAKLIQPRKEEGNTVAGKNGKEAIYIGRPQIWPSK
jgi:hypothetical protein